jgi:hypothetical protein
MKINISLANPLSEQRTQKVVDFVHMYVELLFLIAFLIVFQVYNVFDRQRVDWLIENLRKSDFIYLDYTSIDSTSDGRYKYIPMKVLDVSEQEVTFKVGNLGYTKPVSPRAHAKNDNAVSVVNYYLKKELVLTRSEIAELYITGDIYDAQRPKNIYISGWVVIERHEVY